MLNHEQVLALMRDRVDHPSTPRELLQRLKIPREQRTTFTRLLKDLAASGALVQTRGSRFGLPDRMNLAMHGDRVVARIERITDKGAEGRILRILERGS